MVSEAPFHDTPWQNFMNVKATYFACSMYLGTTRYIYMSVSCSMLMAVTYISATYSSS